MLRGLLIVIVATAAAAPTIAQDTSPAARDTRCVLASKSFSPGATIRAGAKVMACTETGVWADSEKDAAGCFAGDDFYSTGAVAGITGNKDLATVCLKDGTWAPTTAAK